jgi:SAM-dependent methyltransferase
MKMRLPA